MPAFLNAHTLPYNLTDSHLDTRQIHEIQHRQIGAAE